MRRFEAELKVSGWNSEFNSVQKLLAHLGRKTKSESSRIHYLESLAALCAGVKKNPDQLVALPKEDVEEMVQSLLDDMRNKSYSVRYLNVTLAQLQTFLRINGFKHTKELELERYHQPARYRKTAEYIPTDDEIRKMAENSGGLKPKAAILVAYTSGLRNSTLRAILYRDIKEEIESGSSSSVKIPVYPEMKKIDPNACKNSVPYTTFMSKEAMEAVNTYLQEYRLAHGPIADGQPVFQGQQPGRPIKRRTLELMVKNAARRAGIKQWKDVYPHCLRKAFERAVRNSGLDTKDQEFLMGHILEGSQDTYYDKTKIEELRAKYEKVKFFPLSNGEQIRKEAARDQLNILRALKVLPEDKIDELAEELNEKPMDAIDWSEVVSRLRKEGSSQATLQQKAVQSGEAEEMIGTGWRYVGTLPNGKVVLETANPQQPPLGR